MQEDHLYRAYLDTDFIIKANMAEDPDTKKCLLDEVLRLRYQFYCHTQVRKETIEHSEKACLWLENKIAEGIVICISDIDEILKLYEFTNDASASVSFFVNFLRMGADPFPRHIYNNYSALWSVNINGNDLWDQEIEEKLANMDSAVGQGNNLGEIKTNTAIYCDSFLQPQTTFAFYSDDKGARSGILSSHSNVCGYDIMAAFALLHLKLGMEMVQLKPYFDSYDNFMCNYNQPDYKVRDNRGELIKINCREAFLDIFEGKVGIKEDGKLGMVGN